VISDSSPHKYANGSFAFVKYLWKQLSVYQKDVENKNKKKQALPKAINPSTRRLYKDNASSGVEQITRGNPPKPKIK